MTQSEILSVLAHEVGHWKKHHIMKKILVAETLAFLGLFMAYYLMQWDGLPRLVGLDQGSFYARAMVVMFLSSLATFPLTPLFSYLSRRDEREADRFAADSYAGSRSHGIVPGKTLPGKSVQPPSSSSRTPRFIILIPPWSKGSGN